MKKKRYNYDPLSSAIPAHDIKRKFHRMSSYFTNFSNIISKCPRYTLREGLAEMFLDENNADSSSNSSEQVCGTGQQDSMEITDSFQTLPC